MSETIVHSQREEFATRARRSTIVGIGVNAVLATVKGLAGYFGNSYALLADAVESLSDVLSSMIVWFGLKIAVSPPSEKYPYGRGKAETLAGVLVAGMLFVAAVGITIESIHEIITPHHAPASYTLIVLVVVMVVKEYLFRFVSGVSEVVQSSAVRNDAWHHRSDAITSAAAFVGISIALIGGPGWESADDWAAVFAAGIIAINGYLLLVPTLRELLDKAPDPEIAKSVRKAAATVVGVHGTHTCRVRKHGFDFFVELDILCDPDATIRAGHDLAHLVSDTIRREVPQITKVFVHVEPSDDFGRRS